MLCVGISKIIEKILDVFSLKLTYNLLYLNLI
jgi:hypothetical protein